MSLDIQISDLTDPVAIAIMQELAKKGHTSSKPRGSGWVVTVDSVLNQVWCKERQLEAEREISRLRNIVERKEQYSNVELKKQLDRIEEFAKQGRLF